MGTVKRRRAPGKSGGRPVDRKFWFAQGDGDKYPSESPSIRNNVLEPDPEDTVLDSWLWALNKMEKTKNSVWLVVPIDQTDEKRDLNVARASIWRTARRNHIELTSEYLAPYLYIALAR